jgi:hypothetical protein
LLASSIWVVALKAESLGVWIRPTPGPAFWSAATEYAAVFNRPWQKMDRERCQTGFESFDLTTDFTDRRIRGWIFFLPVTTV